MAATSLSDQNLLGQSFFTLPWVAAPATTTARDGLGPLFNARSCRACHRNNAGGTLFNKQQKVSQSLVIRLGKTTTLTVNAPDLKYGSQIQTHGISGVKFEAVPTVSITPKIVRYPDQTEVTLQRPTFTLSQLQYGPLDQDTRLSPRRALRVIGLGMIANIPAQDIISKVDPTDKNNDGISGRANYIVRAGIPHLGRFNWKASAPSILNQSARAAFHDMGLSNSLLPHENCTQIQTACRKAPKGRVAKNSTDTLDLTATRLQSIAYYLSRRKAPQTKPNALFISTGCAKCHTPSYRIPETIYPYSDFLLHDMGAALADEVGELMATGSEWRTPPLWGMRYDSAYLHDGRANTLEQAILWHEGEASVAKQNFMQLPKTERTLLLNFLHTL